MGTTATVAILKPDGKVLSTTVNWDGYVSGAGKVLLEHYTSSDKIERMISGGQISVLAAECDGAPGHSFLTPVDGQTIYYGRDRGETDVEPELYWDFEMWYLSSYEEEYTYLFRNGTWEWKSQRSGPRLSAMFMPLQSAFVDM